MYYLVKRWKPEILHRQTLNFLKRDEGDQCDDDGSLQSKAAKPSVLVHILFYTICAAKLQKGTQRNPRRTWKKGAKGESLNLGWEF